jgi:hypothetical protein
MSQAGALVEHPVTAGVRVAGAAFDPAAVTDVWRLGDSEVETALAGLLELEARTTALRAALLEAAEARDLKARTAASSLERWLGDRFRLSPADVAARHRQAVLLGRHPQVRAALAQAAVTVEQATVLATALDRVVLLPEVTPADRQAAARFLLDQCASLAPRDLARAGQAVLEALTTSPSTDDPADAAALDRDAQRAEDAAQAAERNQLLLRRHRGRLRALLDLGTVGEAVLHAWLRRADTPTPGDDGLEDTRGLPERRGGTLADLLAAAAGTPSDPEDDTGDDTGDDAAGAADEDAGALFGPDDAAGAADLGAVSPLAVLTVTTTLAELRAALAGAGRADTGGALSAATLRQLACDALVVPAVLHGATPVLDLGRSTRAWNRAQRRAAALRDRGCVAPGCHQPPAHCQLHHCWHWVDGGPTDLDNAALLCGFHHRTVHRQGWTVALAPNGYPHLVPPAEIDPQRRPRQHHRYRLTRLTPLTSRQRE